MQVRVSVSSLFLLQMTDLDSSALFCLLLKISPSNNQISDFNSAKADFGTDLAISTRMELNPGNTMNNLLI